MFWLPVIFACTAAGECGFYYNASQITEQQCLSQLKAAVDKFKKDPQIRGAYGACLDVDPPKTSGGKISF